MLLDFIGLISGIFQKEHSNQAMNIIIIEIAEVVTLMKQDGLHNQKQKGRIVVCVLKIDIKKMIKPIVIKQKYRRCDGRQTIAEFKRGRFVREIECPDCKGTGKHEMKITPLRDFKKCDLGNWTEKYIKGIKVIIDHKYCQMCKGTGYIIPKEYEPYEIKKVNKIEEEFKELYTSQIITAEDISNWFEMKNKNNFKEDDKVVITRNNDNGY